MKFLSTIFRLWQLRFASALQSTAAHSEKGLRDENGRKSQETGEFQFFFKNLILSRCDTSRASHLQPFLFCFSIPCLCHAYTFLHLAPSFCSAQSAQSLQSSFKSFLNTQQMAKFQLLFHLDDRSSSASLE